MKPCADDDLDRVGRVHYLEYGVVDEGVDAAGMGFG